MNNLINHLHDFFFNAIPSMEQIIFFVPVLVVYTIVCAFFVGYLKSKKNMGTPYTRKIFHFLIFTAAGLLQIIYGLSVVVIFGSIVSTAVLFAVYKGSGFPFYEAMARPTDRPKRSLFILIPLFTTALGGVLSNIFFPAFASIGYFVGGFGDAIGEPVGTKWGKHRYRVPSLAGVKAERSLEGSTAVLIVSIIAAFLSLLLLDFSVDISLKTALLCGAAATAIEAVSSHGLDNLTIQITAAGVAYWLLS